MGLGLDWFLAGWGVVLAKGEDGCAGGQGGGGGGGTGEGGDGEGGNGWGGEGVGSENFIGKHPHTSQDQYHMMETDFEVEWSCDGGVGVR